MKYEETLPVRRVDPSKYEAEDMVDHMLRKRDLLAEEDLAAVAATRNLLAALHELTRTLNAASDLDLIDEAEVSRWLASNYALAAKVAGRRAGGDST